MPDEVLQLMEQHGEFFAFLILMGYFYVFDLCFCTARDFLERWKRRVVKNDDAA